MDRRGASSYQPDRPGESRAPDDRNRRDRSLVGGRTRSWLRDPFRGRARGGEIDPPSTSGPGARHALRKYPLYLGRGVGSADQAAGESARGNRRSPLRPLRTEAETHSRRSRASVATYPDRRLDSDDPLFRGSRRGGEYTADAGDERRVDPPHKGAQDDDLPRRTYHQRGGVRRTEDGRTPSRCRDLPRGEPGRGRADPPVGEEQIRRDE